MSHRCVMYKNFDRSEPDLNIVHRVLVQMEGTAHIGFPKFEMAKAINFKIIPLIHM